MAANKSKRCRCSLSQPLDIYASPRRKKGVCRSCGVFFGCLGFFRKIFSLKVEIRLLASWRDGGQGAAGLSPVPDPGSELSSSVHLCKTPL